MMKEATSACLSERTAFADSEERTGEKLRRLRINGAADKISKRGSPKEIRRRSWSPCWGFEQQRSSLKCGESSRMGSQGSQKLPKKLQNRMIEVSAAFSKSSSLDERQARAAENRSAFVDGIAQRAAANSER